MYESFYGLRERPFDLTTNLRYLFLTARHEEALGNLQYGLTSQKGIVVLTGAAGTGKTTMIHAALDSVEPARIKYVYIDNPTLTRAEFYDVLANGFGLDPEAASSKVRCLRELSRTLRERSAAHERTALIIDESQSLSTELLEEIRLLANLETPREKLLSVILAGQPEFAARLDGPSMQQFKQRIALRCHLTPLELLESAAYIGARIRVAGGQPSDLFTRESVELIHERAQGIPRSIAVLCDNALIGGFAAGKRPVTSDIVLDVCRDFEYASPTSPSHVRPR